MNQKGIEFKDYFPSVNYFILALMTIVVVSIVVAGCTQSSNTGPSTTVVSVSSPSPPEAVTATTATVAQPVVTIVRYISQTKDIKDSELLFALQVPVEWNVSTYQLMRSDTPDYRTDLIADNVFSLYSTSITNSQDLAYRDEFRQWTPAPNETVVTINGITFDRFESTSEGKTNVSYIVRRSSAKERSYASVLIFTANTSNRFEKEDYEKIVASFRYFSRESAKTETGDEIPLYDPAGNAVSRKVSSLAWGEWEGDSSGGDSSGGSSSGGDSSGGDSSGGGGCGCGG